MGCRFHDQVSSGNGAHQRYVRAHATVVPPRMALDQVSLELGSVYMGVREHRQLRLRNLAQLPSSFSWLVEPEAPDDASGGSLTQPGELSMRISPNQGLLQPGARWMTGQSRDGSE